MSVNSTATILHLPELKSIGDKCSSQKHDTDICEYLHVLFRLTCSDWYCYRDTLSRAPRQSLLPVPLVSRLLLLHRSFILVSTFSAYLLPSNLQIREAIKPAVTSHILYILS